MRNQASSYPGSLELPIDNRLPPDLIELLSCKRVIFLCRMQLKITCFVPSTRSCIVNRLGFSGDRKVMIMSSVGQKRHNTRGHLHCVVGFESNKSPTPIQAANEYPIPMKTALRPTKDPRYLSRLNPVVYTSVSTKKLRLLQPANNRPGIPE